MRTFLTLTLLAGCAMGQNIKDHIFNCTLVDYDEVHYACLDNDGMITVGYWKPIGPPCTPESFQCPSVKPSKSNEYYEQRIGGKEECNDERSALSLLSCSLKLDSSIEHIRNDQNAALDFQALGIAILAIIFVCAVVSLHIFYHYKSIK